MFEGENCESFVIAVAQKMFAEGRQRDDAYIADYVATRLTGKALRWYALLDRDVQKDWVPLRRALLKNFVDEIFPE